MLQVNNVSGGYNGGIVIHNLSFTVDNIFGICGRNGVGKTTLIRLISGELNLSQGDIKFTRPLDTEIELNSLAIFQRQALGISIMPQELMVFSTLTVQENLNLGDNVDAEKLTTLLDYFPILKQQFKVKAGVLSGGEKKILCFVRTLSEKSQIICLDEPSEGVAQENIDLMITIIKQYQQNGISFVICEQNIDFLMKIVNKIMVLDKGESQLIAAKNDVSYEQILKYIHI